MLWYCCCCCLPSSRPPVSSARPTLRHTRPRSVTPSVSIYTQAHRLTLTLTLITAFLPHSTYIDLLHFSSPHSLHSPTSTCSSPPSLFPPSSPCPRSPVTRNPTEKEVSTMLCISMPALIWQREVFRGYVFLHLVQHCTF